MQISKEVKTAIIAIIVFTLTIWGYNYLKGRNIIKPTDTYYIVYDKIDGLIESGNILVKGYKVGTVSQIIYDHENTGKFIVSFSLEERVKIPLNTRAVITSSSPIVPAKDIILEISQSQESHQPGDTLIAGFDEGLAGLLDPISAKAEQLIAQIETTLKAISNIVDDEGQKALQSSINSLDGTLSSVDSQLKEGGSLDASFSNIEAITDNLARKNAEIGLFIDNIQQFSDSLNSANIKSTLDALDSTLKNTEQIVAKINEAQGTAGLLINDSSLYVNLSNSTESLNLLLEDLNENPRRYVHFSLFGGKEKSDKD